MIAANRLTAMLISQPPCQLPLVHIAQKIMSVTMRLSIKWLSQLCCLPMMSRLVIQVRRCEMKNITSKDLWELLKRKLRRAYDKKKRKARNQKPPAENSFPTKSMRVLWLNYKLNTTPHFWKTLLSRFKRNYYSLQILPSTVPRYSKSIPIQISKRRTAKLPQKDSRHTKPSNH